MYTKDQILANSLLRINRRKGLSRKKASTSYYATSHYLQIYQIVLQLSYA